MDTQIAFNKDGKNYNKFHEEIIKCKSCSNPTTMTGTELCDMCWNAKGVFKSSDKDLIIEGLYIIRAKIVDTRQGIHWTKEDKKISLDNIYNLINKVKML